MAEVTLEFNYPINESCQIGDIAYYQDVYLQNSGLGNCINALTSLCIPHGIHPLLVIGHRHTLPQHEVMGRVDKKMLDLIGYVDYIIVDGDNNEQ